MSYDFTRRHFFYGTLLAGAVPAAGFGSTPSLKLLGYKSPNEKLNIASIGAGGKAVQRYRRLRPTENIVALCDVDDKQAARTFKQFEKAPKYKDFRKMLDKEGKNIDAVIVTIPDHMHATAAMWCMERGKHVYVQKPLTRTVWEARQLMEAAAKYKVATQMGNQGYSNEGTRQCAEMIWAGEIGNVTEVHAWTDRPIWPQGLTEIPPPDAGARHARLGPLARRRRAAALHRRRQGLPERIRRTSTSPSTGAASTISAAARSATWPATSWARPIWRCSSAHPTSVECIKKEGASPFMFPKNSVIRFDFPARGNMPAVKMFWYDGLKENPKIQGVPEGECSAICRAVRVGRKARSGATRVLPPCRPQRLRRTRLRLRELPRGPCKIPNAACTSARRQPVHRRQGHAHHRHLRRTDAPAAGREDEGLSISRRRCSPGRPATIATGSAPAKAAIRPARTSTSPRRSSSGCCWA